MELRMQEQETLFPQRISFNYEELKVEITEKAELYKNMVYTDANIIEAKADRAKLNKFKEAIDQKRKEVKKQCLEPYNEFEKQIKELISIIDEPVKLIDGQVRAYEDKQKTEKAEKIRDLFESCDPVEWLTLDKILDPKWLNASVSMKRIQEVMTDRLRQIQQDVLTLSKLPEFSFEAIEIYKETLDINKAISEGQRLADIQKRKLADAEERKKMRAEINAKMAEMKDSPAPTVSKTEMVEPAEETTVAENATAEKTWLRFKALMTVEDALALKDFFEKRNITFGAI